jgi:hypothetical protein
MSPQTTQKFCEMTKASLNSGRQRTSDRTLQGHHIWFSSKEICCLIKNFQGLLYPQSTLPPEVYFQIFMVDNLLASVESVNVLICGPMCCRRGYLYNDLVVKQDLKALPTKKLTCGTCRVLRINFFRGLELCARPSMSLCASELRLGMDNSG